MVGTGLRFFGKKEEAMTSAVVVPNGVELVNVEKPKRECHPLDHKFTTPIIRTHKHARNLEFSRATSICASCGKVETWSV